MSVQGNDSFSELLAQRSFDQSAWRRHSSRSPVMVESLLCAPRSLVVFLVHTGPWYRSVLRRDLPSASYVLLWLGADSRLAVLTLDSSPVL